MQCETLQEGAKQPLDRKHACGFAQEEGTEEELCPLPDGDRACLPAEWGQGMR